MPKSADRDILRVIIATGVTSVVAQLLLIREFLSLFQGNEYVIALILFSWLILGGCGSILARRAAAVGGSRSFLAALSLLLVFLSVIQIPAIRFLRDLLFLHGTSVGFYATFLFILAGMLPYCLLVGFLLPYSLFVLRQEAAEYPGTFVYLADSLGDVGGGALFSFLLVYLLTPLQGQVLAGLPLLFCVVSLFVGEARRRWLILVLALLPLLLGSLLLERDSLSRPVGELVHYQESRYGRIELYRDREQFTLFRDGVPVFSDQNRGRAEEAVHYPLAQLAKVGRVMLIGAESGMLEEVAKYGPKDVDYLELDPAVTAVELRFGLLTTIPGLHLVHQDGRAWLGASSHRYDAIIMTLPEPETFQVNRFYTAEFFAIVRDHLAPGGVFSFTMAGYDNFLGGAQRAKISTAFQTARRYFPEILLLPGDVIYVLCRNQPLSVDIPQLLAARKITTRYISNYFAGDLTPERLAYLRGELDHFAPINTDLKPRMMQLMFTEWFAKFQTTPLWFYGITALLLISYLVRSRREEFALFATGFTVMGSEILVVFAFQVYYGYIYSQIGLIVTVFLAGLLPGAWWAERSRWRPAQILAGGDIALIVLLLLLLAGVLAGGVMPLALLLGFGFFVSLGCGAQFVAALKLGGESNLTASRVFAADLLGGAFGVLLTSVVLIPTVGIVMTALALAILKMVSLLLVIRQ